LVDGAITDAYGREIGSLIAQPRARSPRPKPLTIRQDLRDAARDTWRDLGYKPAYVVRDRFGNELWHLRQPGGHPLTVHDPHGHIVVEATRVRFGGGANAISVTHGVVWKQVKGTVRDSEGALLGQVRGRMHRRYQFFLDEPGGRLTTADAVRLRALLIAIALEERLTPRTSGG
jgi:hypothetical protein